MLMVAVMLQKRRWCSRLHPYLPSGRAEPIQVLHTPGSPLRPGHASGLGGSRLLVGIAG